MPTLSSDSRPIIGRGPSLLARLVVLGLLAVGIMVLDHRQGYLEVARSWLSTGIYPLQSLVDMPFRSLDGMRAYFADRERLRNQNTELQAQLRVAQLNLQRFAALAEENRQLRAVREASVGIDARTAVAEIMRVDIDPQRHRVLLNKGSGDDVYKGQAVLDARGVFGQVTRVGRFAAEAILITDAETATPVRVNRTGLRSIAVGTGDFSKLNLPFITGDADVKVGDLLVTSGLGGIYPPGYPVAEITVVKRDPAAPFATVEAKPLALMNHARELLLVWFEPPTTLDIDGAVKEKAARPKPAAASRGQP
ncbi:MAG: rod shape-determining protein MreC [Candidatus Obscuribacterales bacterium]|nr:rod shape-determining protein MreC [Steroidobacteraceae bacterium]